MPKREDGNIYLRDRKELYQGLMRKRVEGGRRKEKGEITILLQLRIIYIYVKKILK